MLTMTVAEYSRRWLVVVETTRRPQTARNYRWALLAYLIPAFGEVELVDLTRGQVRECVLAAAKHLEPGTARLILAALRAMLNDAVEDEVITVNPAAGAVRRMHLAAGHPKVKAMSAEQLCRFLEAAREPYDMLWYVMSQSGVRIGEAIQLLVSDVDLEDAVLRVRAETSKGEVSRTVELGCATTARLRSHMDRNGIGLLLHGPRGGRVHVDRARQDFKRTLTRAGISGGLTPHSLRHTYASLLVAAGAPLEWLRRQLGHGSIKITVDLYGRHAPMTGRGYLRVLPGG